jgi:hypothetical protein
MKPRRLQIAATVDGIRSDLGYAVRALVTARWFTAPPR